MKSRLEITPVCGGWQALHGREAVAVLVVRVATPVQQATKRLDGTRLTGVVQGIASGPVLPRNVGKRLVEEDFQQPCCWTMP